MRDGYSLNSMGRGPIGNRRGLWQDLKPVPPWVFRKAKRGQTLDLSNLVPLENEPEGSAAATRGPPPLDSVESDSVPDLPGQIWSRVNVRLDRNQGRSGLCPRNGTRPKRSFNICGQSSWRPAKGSPCRRVSQARYHRAELRDELLNGELFYTLHEAQVLVERWRCHYNTHRPHSALGYRPPAPETHTVTPIGLSA